MATKILKTSAPKSKEDQPRAKLTDHEVALIAGLIELYGSRGAAKRLAR